MKISTESDLSTSTPGLVFLSLLAYGRKAGADVQVLSNFRLRVVSTTKRRVNDSLANKVN